MRRFHRLWIKTDAGVSEADIGYFDTDQLHNMVAGKVDLYEEPNVKDANGEPFVNRVLTIMLADEY